MSDVRWEVGGRVLKAVGRCVGLLELAAALLSSDCDESLRDGWRRSVGSGRAMWVDMQGSGSLAVVG